MLATVIALQSPDVAWTLQTEQTTNAGILKSFQARLKSAARGQATDTDSIQTEIESAVQQQIQLFVEHGMMAADEETMAIARKAGESSELVDCMVTMLSYELQTDPISDMESRFIRETLKNLDVRINWDYSIAIKAIPPEQTSVRIRLPKLHPCGGCKSALESALEFTEGFENAIVDLETQTAQFHACTDLDIDSALAEMERSGVQQLTDWKLVRK